MRKFTHFPVPLLFTLFLLLYSSLHGGTLRKNLTINLPGVYAGATAVGDLNNDGLTDIVITGETKTNGEFVRITKIYRNTGNGYVEDSNNLTGIYFGEAALGDYDNDGDLDIAVSGINSEDENVLEIYENTSSAGGSITFTLDNRQTEIMSSENQLRYSSLDWGDYNKDGFLDLAACGLNSLGEASTIIFKNSGGLSYKLEIDVSQVLININKGDIKWADYDNDGDLDLSISGFNTLGQRAAKIFKNNPLGILREDKANSQVIFKLSSSYLEWQDADNDGDLDLLQTGWYEGWYSYIALLENKVGGVLGNNVTFENLTFDNIELFMVGPAAWGDYDNDGDFDIAVMGGTEYSGRSAYILKNNNGTFSIDNTQTELTGLRNGSLKWFDYNNDGKLDLLACGEDENGDRQTLIYDNDESTTAAKPSPPASLKEVFITNDDITFSWEEGSDMESPDSRILNYILRVGQTSGGNDIYSGAVPTGKNNVGNKLSYTINKSLSRTTYYWSVKTVDAQGQVSDEFSPEVSFLVQRFVNSNQNITDLQQSALAWGDYNNDGYYDLIVAGEDINSKSRTVLFDNVNGVLKENIDIILPFFKNGSIAWGDYNNDGYLDLFLSGNSAGGKISYLLKNNPPGKFELDITNSNTIENIDQSSADWGDYDNDGDLDLVLTGVDNNENFITNIYKNTNGILSLSTKNNLSGYANGKVKWIDYDNDGDLDLAVIGDNLEESPDNKGKIYKNNGTGTLTEDESSPLPAVFSSDMAWCDFDSDGDLDVVITGQSLITNLIEIKVMVNEPVGTLTEDAQLSAKLKGVRGGSITWGDYDNDGDADLIISGNDENNTPVLLAYEYDNINETFDTDLFPIFYNNGIQFSSISLIDIENDGDLDLVTIGAGAVNLTSFSMIYDNNEAIVNPNEPPQPPSNLITDVQGNRVLLSWNRGTDFEDNGTDSLALTYVYRIGTTFEGNDIATGIFEPGFGKSGLARSVTIKNLQSNVYYWSVKSVDNGFKESGWASDETFMVDISKPSIESVTIEPQNTGIGKTTVKIIINENFTLNHNKIPIVKFHINGTETLIGQISYDGYTWIGEANILPAMSSGTAVISVDSVIDRQGNIMDFAAAAGTFTIDTELPYISQTDPLPSQTGVSISVTLTALFNEQIIKSSMVDEKSFKLFLNGEKIEGTVDYNQETMVATFKPQSKLKGNSIHEARITGKVKDLVGNTMGSDTTWIFKTAETVLASEGGTIISEVGNVQIYIPPNALQADAEVPISTFSPADIDPPGDVTFTGTAYTIGTGIEVNLSKPGLLTMGYDKNALGKITAPEVVDESKLKIFTLPSASSTDFDYTNPVGGTVNTAKSEIITSIEKLGTYGIFEDKREEVRTKEITKVNFSPRVFSPAGSGNTNLPSKTGISFTLGDVMNISISVFSPSGRFVKNIVDNQSFSNGEQVAFWDGKDANGNICKSGIYIIKIEGEGKSIFKTVAVLNK